MSRSSGINHFGSLHFRDNNHNVIYTTYSIYKSKHISVHVYGYFYLQQCYHATACISAIHCIIHQGQLRSSMKDDKPKDVGYFHEYYLRCQGMVIYVTSLVDSVSLLCQSTEPLIDGIHAVSFTDNVVFQ